MSEGKICIIGAGSSGIAAAKALKQKGLDFDCFEKGSDIGGNWRYNNDNGVSAAYRSLHIDTSRKNLQYPDFPTPDDLPDFPSHWQVMQYLEEYANHFGIRPHIRFRTSVTKVEPAADGQWTVTLENGETLTYRAVIVANGHLWDTRLPDFPGSFGGMQIHSHAYKTAAPFDDQRVLVVGIGNSAVDIAVDLCRRARSVHLSTRRGAWIMPKYILGIPTDRWGAFLSRKLKLPTVLARMIVNRLMYLTVGDQRRYGMPTPKHPMWREHATISQELLPYIGHGWIRVKPNVARLDGARVHFADGSAEDFDAIIYATGYKTSFPFLDPALFQVKDNEAPQLYRRMRALNQPGLYFVGLVQPIGATIPLVEIQSRWLAGVLTGEIALPTQEAMQSEVREHWRGVKRRYVDSARYTLEVDYRDYARNLRTDMESGRGGY
ncbi:MAG: NAD(P)-binding domain-containing protein [Ferrovibrio sp.]|uniref:flavin-containing monooxygenase n=1 Tax=Ferrovibrio sp. TaxID=1917215 RepID=UPI002613FE69|nr:NAD(P)-binding domain-containing protein [Ferrovibrio sp.]MCW0236171.1 NAD(P)-binding domain-containing protein [Ferrovibrio sp.]